MEQNSERQNKVNNDNIALTALKNKIQSEVEVDFHDETKKSTTASVIKTANDKFLIETLSAQVEANEIKKRKHKDWLMIAMGAFLLFQFLLVAIIIISSQDKS